MTTSVRTLAPTAAVAPASAAPRFGALVAMERAKLLRRPLTLICLLVVLGGLAAFMALGYLSLRTSDASNPGRAEHLRDLMLPGGIETSFQITQQLGQLALIVVAASAIGSEYGWGTLRTVLGAGVGRCRWLAAKLVALGQALLLFLLGGVLTGTLCAAAFTLLNGDRLTLGHVNAAWWGDLARSLALTAAALGVMVILACAITTLTRSAAAGIGLGIGWVFIELIGREVLSAFGSLGHHIADALIVTNMSALMQRVGFGPQAIPAGTPGLWTALGLLALYAALLLAAMFVVFRRRDIASGA